LYPDKFKDDEFRDMMDLQYDPKKDYHSYDQQNDDILCGYYVYEYVKAILTNKPCQDVSIQLDDASCIHVMNAAEKREIYKDKKDFLQKHGVESHFENNPSSSPSMDDF
jgi:hypothetical protein